MKSAQSKWKKEKTNRIKPKYMKQINNNYLT